jgi:hypothetical protein
MTMEELLGKDLFCYGHEGLRQLRELLRQSLEAAVEDD